MKELYYKVAGHVFVFDTNGYEGAAEQLQQYDDFKTVPTDDTIFRLQLVETSLASEEFHEEIRQQDEGQEIVVGHLPSGDPYFEFWLGSRRSSVLVTTPDYRSAKISVESSWKFGVNNAIMILYALTTANLRTALFHSSVVSYQGRGYMFLGKSGTGKSTHSRLWLKYIEGTELVNDDNPVVRICDNNEARVYGSPWSGKTPCYRNVDYPIGAIVNLEQAPYNNIRRMKGVRAYAAIVASISGKRWDSQLADGLHRTEKLIVGLVPVWHLECLPDEAAARLCCTTTANG
ncbi:MAG: hypothetical protein IK144_02945 [Bacteroidaceae bacterium]|nr:hypothetical protein [Bacteroidaceae bacterium]